MPLYAVLSVIAAFLALIEGGVGIWVANKDTRKNHELDLTGQCFAYPV
jgi:succinate dehydrogenase hydrophobic anchor subunit